MPRVFTAEPYRFNQMGSFGKAAYMLLRQYQFPDDYLGHEKYLMADHDRCIQQDRNHAIKCLERHTKKSDMDLEYWFKTAKDERVMAFLKDILKADAHVQWTGYRVLGTVSGSGYPIWTLELFAKDPKCHTKVYTGPDAPNVNRPVATVAAGLGYVGRG